MKRILGGLIALVLLAVIAGAGYLFYSLNQPYSGFTQDVYLDIPRGSSTRAVAQMLEEHGVVEHWWQVMAGQAINRRAIQAGEYRFSDPASVNTVLSRLHKGDIFTLELTIPEGSNRFDVSELAGKLGVFPAKTFLEVSAKPALIKDLDPKAESLEGYLFPATYRLTRRTTAEQLARDMTQKFRRAWTALDTKEDVHSTVTIASLVEKEAQAPQDRPLISSVFHNRLEKHMALDCDPTTIYAALLENRYDGVIHRSDLASDNPYNTYRHPGLPPGPIANPGLASIKAALHPADTKYLFFVVKPGAGGAHQFTETLEAHQKAVAEYRRGTASR